MAVTGLRVRKIKPGGAAVIGLFFLFAVFSWNKTTGTYSAAHLAHAVDTPNAKPSAPASRNLPDFVSLVKKIGPSVVNIATTQARRPAQGMPLLSAANYPIRPSASRVSGRVSSLTPTAPLSLIIMSSTALKRSS